MKKDGFERDGREAVLLAVRSLLRHRAGRDVEAGGASSPTCAVA